MKIKPTKIKCLKCGHVWIPRKEEIYRCPKCQSIHFGKSTEEKWWKFWEG